MRKFEEMEHVMAMAGARAQTPTPPAVASSTAADAAGASGAAPGAPQQALEGSQPAGKGPSVAAATSAHGIASPWTGVGTETSLAIRLHHFTAPSLDKGLAMDSFKAAEQAASSCYTEQQQQQQQQQQQMGPQAGQQQQAETDEQVLLEVFRRTSYFNVRSVVQVGCWAHML